MTRMPVVTDRGDGVGDPGARWVDEAHQAEQPGPVRPGRPRERARRAVPPHLPAHERQDALAPSAAIRPAPPASATRRSAAGQVAQDHLGRFFVTANRAPPGAACSVVMAFASEENDDALEPRVLALGARRAPSPVARAAWRRATSVGSPPRGTAVGGQLGVVARRPPRAPPGSRPPPRRRRAPDVPAGVHTSCHDHRVARERPRLVGGDDGRAAERLDGRQLPHHRAFLRAMRWTPTASAIVTTAGSPSGMAATARVTAASVASAAGHPAQQARRGARSTATTATARVITCAMPAKGDGERRARLLRPLEQRRNLPELACAAPVAVTTPVPVPARTIVPACAYNP